MKDKALKYIEQLCLLYENSDKNDQKNVQKIIDNIYRFAHCVRTECSCYHAHKDWRKELKKVNWEI